MVVHAGNVLDASYSLAERLGGMRYISFIALLRLARS